MNRLSLALLAASLLVAGAPFAGAIHEDDPDSEKRADCENDHNQGWVGYNSSRTARYLYENASKGDTETGAGPEADAAANQALTLVVVDNCEGEHWDGQDSVNNDAQDEPTTTNDPACTPKPSETAADDFSVTNCQRADINDNVDGPTGRAPLAFRASGKGSGDGEYQELYVGVDILLVGRVAVYAGTCSDGTRGLEGQEKCESEASDAHGRSTRSAVYLRDNTPDNRLAFIVSSLGVTRGEAGEADCSQERYYQGVEDGNRSYCSRDNTAITADALLP